MRSTVAVALLVSACASSPPPQTPPSPSSAADPHAELVEVPAGRFVMGHDGGVFRDQTPAHVVAISAFRIERTLVTVAAFRHFVESTNYVTTAERRGTGKTAILGMDDWEWREVAGLSWRHPWGEANAEHIPLTDDMPVTMVSWIDADAYCRWKGRRLPTEAEWEYAMRAGATTRFPWGDDPTPPGRPRLNFWEGKTHHDNPASDGYVYLSPARTYPPNAWGIDDPVGNVWQWVADWYSESTFADNAARAAASSDRAALDPRGPANGDHKVARGGSWWCSQRTCHGYGLVSRGKTRPEASFSNNGFRCVEDLSPTRRARTP